MYVALSKKAQHLDVHALISLIILVLLSILLIVYVNGKADNEGFKRLFVVKDTSLLMNTLLASPYDINYIYSVNVSDVLLSFEQQRVTLYDPKYPNALTPVAFKSYSLNADMDVSTPKQMQFTDEKTVSLLFSKQFFLLSVQEQQGTLLSSSVPSSEGASCPSIVTSWDYDPSFVLVDAMIHVSEGISEDEKQAIKQAYDISQILSGWVTPVRTSYLAHKDTSLDNYLKQTLLQTKDKKVLLFIRPVERKGITFYHQTSADRSAAHDKFLCMLSDSLKTAGFSPVTRSSVFPTEFGSLKDAEAEYVVLIEVGSYADLSSHYIAFTDALKKTLEGFFR